MKVQITFGLWKGTIGTLEGAIPGTNWYNVRVSPELRLALTLEEFVII